MSAADHHLTSAPTDVPVGSAALKDSLRSLLELLGLAGLAIAQPVLAVFGGAPEYFVFQGAEARDIVVFGLVVTVGPALVLWGLTQIIGLTGAGGRRLAHVSALGLLSGLLVLQSTGRLSPALGVALALGAGVLLAWAHRRWSGVGLWLRWLSPAAALFLYLFLFSSPVGGLVTGGDVDAAELGAFGSGDPPPVVMLVFDEWPLASIVRGDGTIDADLYPHVAELASGSTWYRDTTTVANLTNFAVPALLTGNIPEQGDSGDAASHPENLFTLLGGTYRLDVTERITRLCPASLCAGRDDRAGAPRAVGATVRTLLTEARDVYWDRLTPGERDQPVTDAFVEPDAAVDQARAATEGQNLEDLVAPRPESLDRFLRRLRPGEEPTLHFIHVVAPHTPHRHLPDGHRYDADPALRLITEPDGSAGSDRRAAVGWPARLDRQRLQSEVAYVDQLLGDVLDRLRATDLYDDALLVVTSDHGIAFRPGATVRGLGAEAVDAESQPELLWVPLFVKAPGQTEAEISTVRAESIDVLPTIADQLGIDLPWPVDGTALTDAIPADRRRRYTRVQGLSFAGFDLDPPAALEADLDDVLAVGVDSVLPGTGPDRWFAVGPQPDLIGRPAVAPPIPVALDDPGAFTDVDLRDEVPAVVAGRIGTDAAVVAIAVNGTVAAVVPTYDDGSGPGRFAALVSAEWLVDGANEITVHARS